MRKYSYTKSIFRKKVINPVYPFSFTRHQKQMAGKRLPRKFLAMENQSFKEIYSPCYAAITKDVNTQNYIENAARKLIEYTQLRD